MHKQVYSSSDTLVGAFATLCRFCRGRPGGCCCGFGGVRRCSPIIRSRCRVLSRCPRSGPSRGCGRSVGRVGVGSFRIVPSELLPPMQVLGRSSILRTPSIFPHSPSRSLQPEFTAVQIGAWFWTHYASDRSGHRTPKQQSFPGR